MRPDLRNILIVSEGRGESARKFLARHRAFSELSAEQSSPTEALVDLLALLKRSSGWSQDAWHNLELDRAVFDVETLLKLLVSPSQLMISGHDFAVTKIDDLIYFVDYAFENRDSRGATRRSRESGSPGRARLERRAWRCDCDLLGGPSAVETGASLHRSSGCRWASRNDDFPHVGGGERRRFNRLAPVDCVAGEWTESD